MGGREGKREGDWEERRKNACSEHPLFFTFCLKTGLVPVFLLLVVTNVHTQRILNQAPIG